ncbi:MAG: FG-GAP repeat protein [Phycisphaerales bacterium]|nr:MAG: FG-GAP repeat protein [Phycisphaerales bacterium]
MLENTYCRCCLTSVIAVAACLILGSGQSAWGQCLVNRLLPSDGASGDRFGGDVAMSGQYILIGAPWFDRFSSTDSGAAYVFQLDGWDWVQQQRLLPSDWHEDDHFGSSVAISGNAAVIAAPGDDNLGESSGSAYVFRHNGVEWIEQVKLHAVDGAAGDVFGCSVGLSNGATGLVAIVGARGNDENGEDAGAAYVFRFDGMQWFKEAKLLASDGKENDEFGTSVAIEEDLIVVGALWGFGVDTYSGAAYVFRRVDGAWIEEVKLVPPEGNSGDRFGNSVSLSGDIVVAGAPRHDQPETNCGAAYVFTCDGGIWEQTEKLTAGDPGEFDYLGYDVAASGNLIAAAAPLDDNEVGENAGAVYIFELDGSNWIEISKLLPFDYGNPDDPHDFGDAVALEGTLPLVGDPCANGTGAAYVMGINEPDCNWNGYCDWYDIATEVSTDCNENAIPDDCDAYQVSKLLASDGQVADNYGQTVSISGAAAVIGANADDDNGENSGSAYVYRYADDFWSEESKLAASDGEVDDGFGYTAAIDGGLVAVGAPWDDDHGEDSGSAYLYRHNGMEWIEQAKLLPSDGAPENTFGRSVGISGDVVIVGADNDDDNGENAGAAYIFRFDFAQRLEQAKLLASDGAEGDDFGKSVDICGDTAIIGAPRHNGNGDDSGAAYIFSYNGSDWIETAKLVASDTETKDYFGGAVAIHGDLAVVGATGDDGAEDYCGSASVFRYDGSDWVEEAKIFASDGATLEMFGISVATDGQTVLIGARWDDDGGYWSGSAYIYRYDGADWAEMKITAPDAEEDDYFGNAVAVDGDHILIGANRADDWTGAAYMFDGLATADCNANGVLDQCDISSGFSDDINNNGIPDECECPADLNGDEKVNIDDLFQILAHWGACDDPANCPWDLAGPGNGPPDGKVNIDDIFAVLNAWGPCPGKKR